MAAKKSFNGPSTPPDLVVFVRFETRLNAWVLTPILDDGARVACQVEDAAEVPPPSSQGRFLSITRQMFVDEDPRDPHALVLNSMDAEKGQFKQDLRKLDEFVKELREKHKNELQRVEERLQQEKKEELQRSRVFAERQTERAGDLQKELERRQHQHETEKKTLGDQVAARFKELHLQQREVERRWQECIANRQRLETYAAELKKARAELQRNVELQDEHSRHGARVAADRLAEEYQLQAKRAQEHKADLQAELEALRTEHEREAKQAEADHKLERSYHTMELEDKDKAVQQLQNQISALQDAHSALDQELLRERRERELLHASLEEAQRRAEDHRLDEAAGEAKAQEAAHGKEALYAQELARLEQRFEATRLEEMRLEEIASQVLDDDHDRSSTSQELVEERAQSEKLQRRLNEAAAETSQELANEHCKHEGLQSRLDDAYAQNSDLKQRLATAAEDRKSARRSAETAEASADTVEQELAETRRVLLAENSEVSSLRRAQRAAEERDFEAQEAMAQQTSQRSSPSGDFQVLEEVHSQDEVIVKALQDSNLRLSRQQSSASGESETITEMRLRHEADLEELRWERSDRCQRQFAEENRLSSELEAKNALLEAARQLEAEESRSSKCELRKLQRELSEAATLEMRNQAVEARHIRIANENERIRAGFESRELEAAAVSKLLKAELRGEKDEVRKAQALLGKMEANHQSQLEKVRLSKIATDETSSQEMHMLRKQIEEEQRNSRKLAKEFEEVKDVAGSFFKNACNGFKDHSCDGERYWTAEDKTRKKDAQESKAAEGIYREAFELLKKSLGKSRDGGEIPDHGEEPQAFQLNGCVTGTVHALLALHYREQNPPFELALQMHTAARRAHAKGSAGLAYAMGAAAVCCMMRSSAIRKVRSDLRIELEKVQAAVKKSPLTPTRTPSEGHGEGFEGGGMAKVTSSLKSLHKNVHNACQVWEIFHNYFKMQRQGMEFIREHKPSYRDFRLLLLPSLLDRDKDKEKDAHAADFVEVAAVLRWMEKRSNAGSGRTSGSAASVRQRSPGHGLRPPATKKHKR